MNKYFFVFTNRDILLRIPINNIVYFEAEGNFTVVTTINKLKQSVYANLGQIESVLKEHISNLNNEDDIFIRIGRGLIVNRNYIYMINTIKKEVTMSDCKSFVFKLNCSRDSLKKIREQLGYKSCECDNEFKTTIKNC